VGNDAVAVPFTFTKFTQPVVVSSAGLTFSATQGAGAVPTQTFNVQLSAGYATGTGPDYTVDVLTAAGPGGYAGYGYPGTFTAPIATLGANSSASWLGVSVPSVVAGVEAGNTNNAPAAAAAGGLVTVSASVSNLAPGTYSGTIRIRHSGAAGTSFSGDNPVLVPVTLTVAAAPALTLSSTATQAFTYTQSSGAALPLTKTVTAISTSAATPLPYTLTATGGPVAPCAVPWLTATPGLTGTGPVSGGVPDIITISVPAACLTGATAMQPGTYTGNVAVNAPLASTQIQNIPVTLVISAAPGLSTTPASLNAFSWTIGAPVQPQTQTLTVSSGGTAYSAAFVPGPTGGAWATVTNPATTPTIVLNSAVVSTLTAGTYTGSISITDANASNSPLNVPIGALGVSLVVSPQPTITVNAPAQFNFTIGGTAPTAQNVLVTIANGPIALTSAVAVTTPAGGSWLGATLSTTNATNAATLAISVTPTGLAACPSTTPCYTGTVTVSSPNVTSASVTVNLLVSAQPTLSVSTASLAFTYTMGNTASTPLCTATGAISVTGSSNGLTVTPAVTTNNGGPNWLLSPTLFGGTTPTQATICVTPSLVSPLAPGVYTGSVQFTSPGAVSASITPITLTVNAQPTLAAATSVVAYNYTIGAASGPAAQTPVAITSTPTGVTGLTATNTGSCAWLGGGLTGTTAPSTLAVPVSITGLAPNTYSCVVTVNGSILAGNGSGSATSLTPAVPTTVTVNLTVNPQPVITALPTLMAFSFTMGGTVPPSQVLAVSTTNPTGQTVSAAAASTPTSWLTVSPATSANNFLVSVVPGTLGAGTYLGSITLTLTNAVTVTVPVTFNVAAAPQIAFFNGSVSVGNGVDYLTFANGNLFGYYTPLSGGWIFHFDMGYEYMIDGGNGTVYMYDYASGHWLYSSSTLFPYLYDFTLKTWIYYNRSTTAGHYTSNPRTFVNLTTSATFTM
jgi:hypothetical protein